MDSLLIMAKSWVVSKNIIHDCFHFALPRRLRWLVGVSMDALGNNNNNYFPILAHNSDRGPSDSLLIDIVFGGTFTYPPIKSLQLDHFLVFIQCLGLYSLMGCCLDLPPLPSSSLWVNKLQSRRCKVLIRGNLGVCCRRTTTLIEITLIRNLLVSGKLLITDRLLLWLVETSSSVRYVCKLGTSLPNDTSLKSIFSIFHTFAFFNLN